MAAGVTIASPANPDEPGQPEQRMRGFTLTWTGPAQFRLAEDGRVWAAPETAQTLAKFGSVNTDPGDTGAPAALHQVEYKIDAGCEIAGGDTYKVNEFKPGKRASNPQKNAIVLTSMLSRLGALGGDVGSSKAECPMKRARPSVSLS